MRNLIAIIAIAAAVVFAAVMPHAAFAAPSATPTSINSVVAVGASYQVAFNDGSAMCIPAAGNAVPHTGSYYSHWTSFWSASFPFYHYAGLVQADSVGTAHTMYGNDGTC